MRLLVIAVAVLLVSQSDCLPRLSQRILRRYKRQYVPPKIPYASIRTGRIPERLKNRLRTGSASRTEKTTSSSSSEAPNSDSKVGSSSSYGGQFRNPYGGQYNPLSNQGYGQTTYGQRNTQGGVPIGASTYPYLGGLSTYPNYDNPYSAMRPPNPQTAGYQPQLSSYQPMSGYSPYGGYGGGYQMAGNPYATQGGAYGGAPRMPYMNPYAMTQTGTYGHGTGYPSRGRPEVGASIGSPYRDPNARFTSYIHPNPQSSSSRGYQSGSSYGAYGGGSSQYGRDPYDSVSSQSGSSQYGRDPYDSVSSQSGYSSYYGGAATSGTSYGERPSSSGQTGVGSDYESGAAYGRYGGGSSYASAAEPSEPAYGGQRNGAGRFVSGNSGGSYATDSSSRYGVGAGSSYESGENDDQYGRGSMYSGRNSQPADDPYSQTSGSQYGGTSESQYSYGGSRPTYGGSVGGGADSQQYSSYGQSYPRTGVSGSQARDGQGQQTEVFRNPSTQDVPSSQNPSSSSRFSQSYQGGRQLGTPQHTPEGGSRTSGRYYNPSYAQVQTESRVSESHQTGRFYNPPSPTENDQSVPVSNAQDTEEVSTGVRNPGSPTSDTQSDSPVIVVEPRARPFEEPASRERYTPQEGTFLIPRRKEEKTFRKQHPAMKKCETAEDGLPDLYLDPAKMKTTVHLQVKSITKLGCAKQEGCFPKSVDDVGASLVRKLLRFATIAHNIGTAVFYPHRNYTDWKFHQCHGHYHSMKEFAHFHLFFPDGTVAAEGHKASFCLEDSGCTNPCKKSFKCTNKTQGISPGCYDSYLASRDCQWIDVTDVETGIYTLRITVNPLVNGYRAVPELSYTNNAVECKVSIGVRKAQATKCWVK